MKKETTMSKEQLIENALEILQLIKNDLDHIDGPNARVLLIADLAQLQHLIGLLLTNN